MKNNQIRWLVTGIALAILSSCSSTLAPIEQNAIAQGESLVQEYASEITGYLPITPASAAPISKP